MITTITVLISHSLGGGEVPSHLMSIVELVLDQEDQLVEEKRLPGENNVSVMLFFSFTFHDSLCYAL